MGEEDRAQRRRRPVDPAQVIELERDAILGHVMHDLPLEAATDRLPGRRRRRRGNVTGEARQAVNPRPGVGERQLREEERLEPRDLAESGQADRPARPVGRELAGERDHRDAEHARGHQLRSELSARGVLLDPSGVDPREQRRLVDPMIDSEIVLDELEADQGERAAAVVGGKQAVAHAQVEGVGLLDEKVEAPIVDGQATAELAALEPPAGPGLVLGVRDEPVEVGDLDVEVDLRRPSGTPAGEQRLVEVGLREGDPPGHLLGEGDPAHQARSIIRSENRSARAAMVRLGFGPTGPGITDPSATNSPRWTPSAANTSPRSSTTP